jgi:hypothetical protein
MASGDSIEYRSAMLGHLALLSVLLALCGCGSQPHESKPEHRSATEAIERDVTAIEEGVRLAAANKRIDDLERQVADLKTNPQTIELDLLKARVEAVETKIYAKTDAGVPTSAALIVPTPRVDALPASRGGKGQRLILPELETARRPGNSK